MTFIAGVKRTSIYAATVALSLAATTANAACSDPAAPNVNWRDCDKSGADLTNANLRYADLARTNLSGADLTGAILIEANLSYAGLDSTVLVGANLRDVNLTGADLAYANWSIGRICKPGSVGKCD